MKLRLLTLTLLLFSCFSVFGQSSEFDAGGFDAMRIENEIKLAVPNEIVDSVWNYLKARYDNDNLFLKEFDAGFSTKIAEDFFIDQYYDNEEMQLLKRQFGVRHRSRYVLTDQTDRKNGRQLLQVKVNDIDDNMLNRAEYKYPIKFYGTPNTPIEGHPLFRKIHQDHRKALAERLHEFGIDAFSLFPTIKIEQLRRRVYVSLNGNSFATMTLDGVTASFSGQSTHYTELELELNEINYTLGDSTARAKMEAINESIKGDLLATFPSIKQDQTPKYNKGFEALGLKDFSSRPLFGVQEEYLSVGLIFFLLLATFLSDRLEKKAWEGQAEAQLQEAQ
ncbi:MAG: CYTH domain-containing protein [Phaeodactylibacter sp.]|nr:CYTH domain-containing protein [Phaeodactylibacter sp.]MCB9297386.1 CYTH domain-containing protein [Lewinellaceae bacterium]